LPTTGQLYGSKSTINLESLISANPQAIIDLGDRKEGIASDMDALQKQTGIASIYLEADLPHMSEAYRTMGQLFGLGERAEAIASFIDETMKMAEENSAKIPDKDRKSVMFTSGSDGLDTNAYGSSQAQVIELVGGKNAVVVEDVSSKGGGNSIDMEQLYNFDPEVIIFSNGSIYDEVGGMAAWKNVAAIKNGSYYEIPSLPYNWMSSPPSVNMVLGIWWLGNLLYPDIYDYDMADQARKIYKLLWNYELSAEEARELLSASTLKNAG
jgi:iron complex transport system substrate-binding protein